jgi:hypothetical protein
VLEFSGFSKRSTALSKCTFLTPAQKIEQLEAKLQQKNNGMAEMLQEYIELKRELGEPESNARSTMRPNRPSPTKARAA